MSQLKISLLGVPQIELAGRPVITRRRKAIALLAYLAATAGAHTRDSLATLLWPDYGQSQALAYLRRTIWEVNKAIGKGWLATDGDLVRLDGHSGLWVDTIEFANLLAQAKMQSETLMRLPSVVNAVSLYRGDFLSGFTLRDTPAYDQWQLFEAEHLKRQLLRAYEQLSSGYEQNGELDAALEFAQRWLTEDQLQEEAHRQLMRVYARMGQRPAALRQYEQCRQILDEELDLSPQAETITLYEQIASGAWPPAESSKTQTSSPEKEIRARSPRLSLLPTQPTPFVGRTRELERIGRLLDDPKCRLLTLMGPGGSGKTRLAIQAARKLASNGSVRFDDGVGYVPLAPLASADLLLTMISKALHFTFFDDGQEPRQQLLDLLGQRQLLLLLDNFEHLIDPFSLALISDILTHCPTIAFLITSRIRLNIPGEQLFVMEGMSTPDLDAAGSWQMPLEEVEGYSALRLFRQSARRIRPDFEWEEDNLRAAVRICQLVEGMPLGIELAVGWLEMLTPSEIVVEIENSLDFLETGQHVVPERQRSIRAVFLSSWRLLPELEQAIFSQLTVFRGGLTRRAAQFVGETTLMALRSLVNKSWLQHGPDGRYHIHELLRQYGEEKLQQNKPTWRLARQRHADYFADFVERQTLIMRGPRQKLAFEAVGADFDNIATAWHWLASEDQLDKLIRKMVAGLYSRVEVHSSGEELLPLIESVKRAWVGRKDDPDLRVSRAIWLTFELDYEMSQLFLPPEDRPAVQRAWELAQQFEAIKEMGHWYVRLTTIYTWLIDPEKGLAELGRLVDILNGPEQRWLRAMAQRDLGDLLFHSHHWEESQGYLTEALQLYSGLGDELNAAKLLSHLGSLELAGGNYQEATEKGKSAIKTLLELGSPAAAAQTARNLADFSFNRGHFQQGFDFQQQRRQLLVEMGHKRGVVDSLHLEALNALRFSDNDHAQKLRQATLEMARELDQRDLAAWSVWETGEIYRVSGDLDTARQHYDQSLILFEKENLAMGLAFCARSSAELAMLEGRYDEALPKLDSYLRWARESRYDWSEAYALNVLCRLALLQAWLQEGRRLVGEALRIAWDARYRDLAMVIILSVAELLYAEDRLDEAAELGAFVANHYLTWRETKARAEPWLAELRSSMDETAFLAAQERGRSLELDSVIKNLIAELSAELLSQEK